MLGKGKFLCCFILFWFLFSLGIGLSTSIKTACGVPTLFCLGNERNSIMEMKVSHSNLNNNDNNSAFLALKEIFILIFYL
jgi:hypothetical protein